MRYITGIHALNLPCGLETSGERHQSSLSWEHPATLEKTESIFGDYGIADCCCVPDHHGRQKAANHIRALLDLLAAGNLSAAQVMRHDFITTDKYDSEIFEKVAMSRGSDKWEGVNEFMGREYGIDWLKFLGNI